MQPSFCKVPPLGLLKTEHSRKARWSLCLLGLAFLLLSWPLFADAQLVQIDSISTVAGNGTAGFSGDGGSATSAELRTPAGLALDHAGNLYFADTVNERVRMVSASTGIITTVAGNGTSGFAGDGGPATSAELHSPRGVALDSAGNLYIADTTNARVRMVSATTGIITTFAGNGMPLASGDGGPAASAAVSPYDIAIDATNNIYITDDIDVRMVSAATGIITTVAGNGTEGYAGDGGPATSAAMNGPDGIALDRAGNLYIADSNNCRIRMVTVTTGIITTIAGNGTCGYSGDDGSATSAELNVPGDVTVSPNGNVYISDVANHRVRMVTAATGIVTTIAGDGTNNDAGDGGLARSSEISTPVNLAVSSAGSIYVSDGNSTIRQIALFTPANTNLGSSSAPQNLFLETTAAETITSFTVPASQGNKQEYTVGKITGCVVDGKTSNPVGTVCTLPITFRPAYPGLRPVPLQAVTSAGNTNIGLQGLGFGPLLSFTPGILSTLAGNYGVSRSGGDGGPATAAYFADPTGLTLDNAGNIYISDTDGAEVRKIDVSTGIISKVAGLGPAGGADGGDGGPATSSSVGPNDVALDSAGNLYIADAIHLTIREVDAATGIITTVAGKSYNRGLTGPPPPSAGDGGPATGALFNIPGGIAFDRQGNLYIVDTDGCQIRKVDASTGIISTLAGIGSPGSFGDPTYTGDGGPATKATLFLPEGIAVDPAGNVYFSDDERNVVRRIDGITGIISTYAGDPNAPFNPGHYVTGPATTINISADYVKVDSAGNLYIAGSDAVRRVDAVTKILSPVAYGESGPTFTPLGDGLPATGPVAGELDGPAGIALDGSDSLYVTDELYLRKIDTGTSAYYFVTATPVGTLDTTDDPQAVTVTNAGNAQLMLAVPPSGTNPVVSPASYALDTTIGNLCEEPISSSSPGIIDPGNSCAVAIDFDPTVGGTVRGTVVLTNNTLATGPANGTAYAMQSIPVRGFAIGASSPAAATLAPASLSFSTTAGVLANGTQTATLGNPGGAPLTITSIAITGTNASFFTQVNDCGTTLPAGASCLITVSFTGTTVGSYSAVLGVTDNATPATQTTALAGTVTGAPQAKLSPATFNFGSIVVGSSSAAQTFTLTNAGTATLPITSLALSGTNASSFAIGANTCGSSLAAGANCTVAVTFSPSSVGSFTTSLSVVDAAGTQTSTLNGTGTPAPAAQAALTPSTATFGSVSDGSSSSAQTFTLTNAGTAALSITSVALSGTNASSFAIGANTCGSSLAAGAHCSVGVTFSPSSASNFTALLSVVDAVGTQTSTLNGTGTATPAAQAALTPATATFGSVTDGSSSSAQTFTLTNAGGATLSITSLTLNGANASSFVIGANTCGSSLAAGAHCSVGVTFSPSSASNFTALLSVVDAVGTQTSTLNGTGTPAPAAQAALTPSTATFGSVTDGSSSSAQTFTLTNAGTATLSITSVALTGTNASSFVIGANTCGSSLAAGAHCSVAVTFSPSNVGSFTASLTVVDAVGTQTSELTGSGVAPLVPPDFTIAATPAAQSSYRGVTVSYTVQLTSVDPGNPFKNSVTLSAIGLPAGASAIFSPSSVVPGTTQAAITSMTVTVPALSAHNSQPSSPRPFVPLPAGLSLASLCFVWFFRRKGKRRLLLVLLVAITGLAGTTAALTGCGSTTTGFAVPSSTSTITVTGASGSTTHSTSVTLTVK